MSARIVNTIAEAIDDGPDPVTRVTELSREILDALRANGFEVVELPEPEDRESEHEIATCWDHLPHQILVWDSHPDEVQWAYNFEPGEPLTPTEALELAGSLAAAALLAAANAAGEQ